MLDQSNWIYTYKAPFRVSLNTYLNFIQMMNSSDNPSVDFKLPADLAKGSPPLNASKAFDVTNPLQKVVTFLLMNGLRPIREWAL